MQNFLFNIFKIGDIKSSKRIIWIDYAKFIAITIMILGHTNLNQTPYICLFGYIFHMPIFFFISGLFEKGASIGKSLMNVTRTLIVPYFVFSLFSFSYCWCYPILHPELYPNINSFTDIYSAATLGTLFMENRVREFSFLPNYPLWFLAALMVAKILFSIFHSLAQKLKINNPLYWIVISFISVFLFLKSRQIYYFSIDSALMGFPLYVLAYHIKIETQKRIFENYAIPIFILSFLYTLFVGMQNGAVNMDGGYYGKSLIMFYINAIIAIFMVISFSYIICKKFKPIKFASYLGANTLVILGVHNFILQCIKGFIVMILGIKISKNDLLSFLITVIILILCIPISKFINAKLSWIIGKKQIKAPSSDQIIHKSY